MERAILSGEPQFVVASINALITATEAVYIIRLDEFFRNAKIPARRGTKWGWGLMLSGWWVLTFCTVVVVARIVASAWFSEQEEVNHCWFQTLDIAIIILMGVGYFLLAAVGFLAWPFCRPPWRETKIRRFFDERDS